MKAYPYQHKDPTTGLTTISEGMTLRDWFAGQAIPYTIDHNNTYEDAAASAYRMADAMLKEREA